MYTLTTKETEQLRAELKGRKNKTYRPGMIWFPESVKPSKCEIRTQSYLRKMPHGAIRVEVKFSVKEMEMPPVIVYSREFNAELRGKTDGKILFHNGYRTISVLVTDSKDETAKILIGTYQTFLIEEVRQID